MVPLDELKAYLAENHVRYELIKHQEKFTAEELASVEHVPGREQAKVVILRSGNEFLMAVLPALYHVDFERTRAATGKHDLELATENEFANLFRNCEPGAMPPFGNLYGLPVWVDESLARDEYIVFNACSHSEAIRMKYSDFARLVRPKVALLRTEAWGAEVAPPPAMS